MPQLVTAGAMMMCSFGLAPSVLSVLPINRTMATTPAANIMDFAPMVNIPPFA
ncbi:MAG: PAAR-like protein, partial [Verrucomicrobiota bacterium]